MIDWRKPLQEGPGPDETDNQPHDYQSMSLLGVVFKHRSEGSKKVQRKYIPILSKNRDHNSYAVEGHLDALWEVVEQNTELMFFLCTKKRLEIRFDNASHFVSKEFLYYVCQRLPNLEIFAHFKEFSL